MGYPPSRYDVTREDAGNGSLMRLAPVAIFYCHCEELAVRACVESSFSTHPGHVAADACGFMGFLLARCLHRGSEGSSASTFIDDCVAAYLVQPGLEDRAPLLVRLLRSTEQADSKERCWNWRDPAGPFLLESLQARGSSYNGYPVGDGSYFGSYCLDALAIALRCVYHTDSFTSAVVCCVNYLGDADSTAAICGQIAGAFYGYNGIDARMLERLHRWDAGETALRATLLFTLGHTCTELRPLGPGCCQLWPVETVELDAADIAVVAACEKAIVEARTPELTEAALQTCQGLLGRQPALSYPLRARVFAVMATVHQSRRQWVLARQALFRALSEHDLDVFRDSLRGLERAEAKSNRVEAHGRP